MESLQIVLLGESGSGKTTLYNRITKSEEITYTGGNLCTKKVFCKSSAFGKVPFKVLDTPGFGAQVKKIDRAAGIMAAFREGPVNRIILVLKLSRIDEMTNDYKKIIAPFSRYRELITILVTHWDNQEIKEQANNMKQIKDRFEKFNIKSFIFSSKNDSGAYTCDLILKEIANSQPKQVDLFESDYLKFDLAEFNDDLELDLEKQRSKLSVQFSKIVREISCFIKKYPLTSPAINDVMHILTLESKNLAEKILAQFEKDNWGLFNKLIEQNRESNLFLFHILLKQEIENQLRQIREQAQQKMRQQQNHCFNFIKKCPHCSLIWMKDQGCDQDTFLCSTLNNDKQSIQSPPIRWQIIWNRDVIDDIQIIQEQTQNPPKKTKQNQGCGQSIIWQMMSPLTVGELNELVDPGLQDYYCEQDKSLTQKLQKEIEKKRAQIIRN